MDLLDSWIYLHIYCRKR